MNFRKGWDSRTPGTLLEHWGRYVPDRPENGCWIWQGTKDKGGYGKICHEAKHMRAHRVSYQLHVGELTADMFVCHSCDNPSCVNPKHLFLGTHKDNMIDMVRKDRSPRQKLTASAVLKIRQLLTEGYGAEDLAVMFGVHVYTIRRIRNGRRWGHLQEAA